MIQLAVYDTPAELGQEAAKKIAEILRTAIAEKGEARIITATGASQFETIDALTREDVEWDKVTMFHLDEYVGLPESHIASFRKYLKERFASKINLKAAYYVNGEGDVEKNIAELGALLKEKPADVAIIGIGENGHIAFNDPPADFETDAAYMIVDLDDRCKMQQVGEGWFAGIDDVPKQAITMCVKQIMSAEHIVSAIPHSVKAEAVYNTFNREVTPEVPATILKTHPDWNVFLDRESAKLAFHL